VCSLLALSSLRVSARVSVHRIRLRNQITRCPVEDSAQSGNNYADRSTVSVRPVRSSVQKSKRIPSRLGSVVRHPACCFEWLSAEGTRPSSSVPATHGPSHPDLHSCRPPCLEQGSGARQQLHQRRPWFSPHGRHVAERQPFWAAWPPSAPSSVCSVTPCSSNLVRARTALSGMSFSRFQAWLKPCLGSLEQGTSTGLQCLWTLWRARIQRPNRTQNRTPNAEPDMRRT